MKLFILNFNLFVSVLCRLFLFPLTLFKLFDFSKENDFNSWIPRLRFFKVTTHRLVFNNFRLSLGRLNLISFSLFSHGSLLFFLFLLLLESSDKVRVNFALSFGIFLFNNLAYINSKLNSFFHLNDWDGHCQGKVAISDRQNDLLSAFSDKLRDIKFRFSES